MSNPALDKIQYLFTPRKNGTKTITFQPVEGFNYDIAALYYSTPYGVANGQIRDVIIKQFRDVDYQDQIIIYDICANIGGTTLSFLENAFSPKPDIGFVMSFEKESTYANMLRRNINEYGYGSRSVVINEE